MRRLLSILLFVLAFLSLGGCAVNRATANVDPSLQWDKVKTLHVVQTQGEDGSTRKLITEKFKGAGFAVTSDPEPMGKPDAVVSYVDRWMWDITMYMLELTITLKDPQTNAALASGNSYHTSLTRKSPTEMVDEVVGNILKNRPKPN